MTDGTPPPRSHSFGFSLSFLLFSYPLSHLTLVRMRFLVPRSETVSMSHLYCFFVCSYAIAIRFVVVSICIIPSWLAILYRCFFRSLVSLPLSSLVSSRLLISPHGSRSDTVETRPLPQLTNIDSQACSISLPPSFVLFCSSLGTL